MPLNRLFSTASIAFAKESPSATLQLNGGLSFCGKSFGAPKQSSGEVVFTTSLVGYPESMTDPSYRGQILVFTQPLIGNYGVPSDARDAFGLLRHFESDRIQVKGIIVSDYAEKYSHWNAVESLGNWCSRNGIPAISGIDTRRLTQHLRSSGSTLGEMVMDGVADETSSPSIIDPNTRNLIAEVSTPTIKVFNRHGRVKVALIDCGVKHNIIRHLVRCGAEVHLVPFDFDPSSDPSFDAIFVSNGPGNPNFCVKTISTLRKLINSSLERPIFGICMGNLLLGMAAGIPVNKLAFGNRGHNVPVMEAETRKCFVTSQNHGYALDDSNLPVGWQKYFMNLNDRTNEGIRHVSKPFSSVQFHPEACGGPQDCSFLFDQFISEAEAWKKQHRSIASQPISHRRSSYSARKQSAML